MSTVLAPENASTRLLDLIGRLDQHGGFREVVASLEAGHAATLDGVWGAACSLAAARLAEHCPATLLVVCPEPDGVDPLVDDLALFTTLTPQRFPAGETLSPSQVLRDEAFGERLSLLKRLTGGQEPRILVADIQSLLQPVPDRLTLTQHTRWLRIGEEAPLAELAAWLAGAGLHHTTAVELPGEFSVRGGIVDVFAPDWDAPVRIELFGDEIESIRRFDAASQRSLARLDAVDITLVDPSARFGAHLAEYLPERSWIMLIEPGEMDEQGRQYLERVEAVERLHGMSEAMRNLTQFPSVTAWAVAPASLEATCQLRIESVERFSGEFSRVRDELDEAGSGQDVFVVCPTEAEVQRLGELFAETQAAQQGRLHLATGTLSKGFRLVPEQTVLLSSAELFHREDLVRPVQRRLGRVIDSFLDLRLGELVVHVAHGIARYRGLKLLEKGEQREEHLELEFHGGTRLYVPSSKIGLVQKYVGGSKSRPTLARLGGQTWVKQKARVARAVTDMAAEMLELQAARASRPGIAFPPDSQWQREFDASFPYHETPDQLVAIEAIKTDMTRPQPMDRLLCGDVGYGKTELAMRAAFKAVEAGYQVAILVPTTILAEQHYRTFSARMAEFPFQIASLSRFLTRRQQAEVIERLTGGSIDIVIGTHRLAQRDVRFQNLGLVIIDEEQRFGVEVKEHLKALRSTVDVLTMTATPIPRTLHLSVLGVRDISNLETPPEDRLPVETRVTRLQPELIRHAVERELNRGGQVFFVHNRIEDIFPVKRRLEEIVPEASIGVGHGQMREHELERVMLDFVSGRCDILLATTIVENGLDIPNANTIFIDEADRYGLADLHQLRGRVGRYKHRAYCYLLIDPRKNLTPNAAKRLRAIEEFSDMGAGFAIAMRDLEIRGAGNILGTEQSGHIAVVGYELYCSLLEQAVRNLKRLPPATAVDVDVDLPVEAYLPPSYVPDMRSKIDLYRRLARVSEPGELADFRAELADRFGDPPPVVQRLLELAGLRIAARHWGVQRIHWEDQYLVLDYRSGGQIRRLADRSGGRLRVVDGRSAYLPLGQGVTASDGALEAAKSLLLPN